MFSMSSANSETEIFVTTVKGLELAISCITDRDATGCRFWENLAKSYVGTPGGLAPPPWGNPGSATGYHSASKTHVRDRIF